MKKYLDPSKLKLELVKEEYNVVPSGVVFRSRWKLRFAGVNQLTVG